MQSHTHFNCPLLPCAPRNRTISMESKPPHICGGHPRSFSVSRACFPLFSWSYREFQSNSFSTHFAASGVFSSSFAGCRSRVVIVKHTNHFSCWKRGCKMVVGVKNESVDVRRVMSAHQIIKNSHPLEETKGAKRWGTLSGRGKTHGTPSFRAACRAKLGRYNTPQLVSGEKAHYSIIFSRPAKSPGGQDF